MSGIKTKLWYGGGPALIPGRSYSPARQNQILDKMFGYKNSGGPLVMPDRTDLYVGRRSKGKPKYSYDYKPAGRSKGFALFTPALPSGDHRPMLKLGTMAAGDGESHVVYKGFLPTAVKMLLILGRHSLQDMLVGEETDFEPIGEKTSVAARLLADNIIWQAFFADPEGSNELMLEDFWTGIDNFLGPKLAEVEFADPADEVFGGFDGQERPFEKYGVDMIGRIAEIAR